jgi:hypothetical protein
VYELAPIEYSTRTTLELVATRMVFPGTIVAPEDKPLIDTVGLWARARLWGRTIPIKRSANARGTKLVDMLIPAA